jgi:hypothetical protein
MVHRIEFHVPTVFSGKKHQFLCFYIILQDLFFFPLYSFLSKAEFFPIFNSVFFSHSFLVKYCNTGKIIAILLLLLQCIIYKLFEHCVQYS